jgi:capsular polysaccharide transport system permease protein
MRSGWVAVDVAGRRFRRSRSEKLAGSLRTNGRVLLALMLREARTRYGRRRAGYFWALVEPMTHIALFYFIFRYLARAVPLGDSLAVFLATGFAPYLGYRNVNNRTQGGYGSNQSLLSFPIVKLMDVFLGRALLELATWVIVTFLLFGGLYLMGQGELPHRPLLLGAAILSLFCIGFGGGVVVGLLSEFLPSVRGLMSIPQRFLYFASGVFYLPESMPPPIRDVIDWIPMAHAITLFRAGYFEFYDAPLLDVRYLFYWSVGSLLAAFVAERIARRPIRNLA